MTASDPSPSRKPEPFESGRVPEALRDEILRRLARIEDLAIKRIQAGHGAAELEARSAELDAQRESLRAREANREAECNRIIASLERDRERLTEAWRRIELKEIADAAAPRREATHPALHREELARPKSPAREPAYPDPEDPISESLTRQFQGMLRDIRQNGGPGGGRS